MTQEQRQQDLQLRGMAKSFVLAAITAVSAIKLGPGKNMSTSTPLKFGQEGEGSNNNKTPLPSDQFNMLQLWWPAVGSGWFRRTAAWSWLLPLLQPWQIL